MVEKYWQYSDKVRVVHTDIREETEPLISDQSFSDAS